MTQRIGSLILAAAIGAGSALAAPAPPAKPAPKPTPPPAVLEGIVVGPDAKPVADAVVVASSAAEFADPPIIVRTDAEGRFRVQPRRAGPQAVRIQARGLAAQTIEKTQPGAPLRVTLAKGGFIEGVVRDAASGRPVPDARIEAREDSLLGPPPWEPGIGVVSAQSDAKGAFRLEGLARGRHTITASSRIAGRAAQSGVALGKRVELLLTASPSIIGRVVLSSGRPAAGAAVRAELEMGPSPARLTAADPFGHFEIGGLSAGAYRVVASHKEGAVAIAGGVRVETAGDAEIEIVLAPPVRVTGRLVDTDERPLTGTVTLQEIDGQPSPRALGALVRAEAGADGRFALERIPPGSHALAVTGRGVAARRVAIDVGARQKVLDLGDLVLEAGPQIRGRVRDKAGAPIADAIIRGFADTPASRGVPPIEGRTETDGAFVLGGASAPSYRLTAEAPGFARMSQSVDAPNDAVEVVLEAAGGIAGLVVDDAGRPVEAFEVTALPSGEQTLMSRTPRMRAVVSEAGRFTLDDMAAGTYTVEVTARDLGRQVVSNVKVATAAVTDLGRIRLSSGGSVRGNVLDATSAPVPGATVEARGSDRAFFGPSDFQQTTADSGGAFQLRGLPAGTVVIVARHPDFAEGRSAPVEIQPARTAETSVMLTRGGRIEGVIRRRGPVALPEATVSVRSQSSPADYSMPAMVVVQADGSFAIDHVVPGPAAVAVMTRSGSGGSLGSELFKLVDVREGETARVEFLWREILLTGKVTRGGVPLANIRLIARGASGSGSMFVGGAMGGLPAPVSGPQRMTAVTREDGSYEMIVGDVGRWAIRAESAVARAAFPMRMIEVADVDTQTVDLDYPAGGISGIVVDEQTGAPIARASVAAMPGKAGGTGGGQAMTRDDGRFNIDVDPGEFRLRASAEGHTTERINVTVGESPIADVRIALSRGAALRGRVVDRNGRPAAGVWLMASEETDEDMGSSAESLPDGSFEFSSLRPGSYSISGGSALGGFGTLAGISPGAEGVVLRLLPGGRIRVRVKAADGTPAARAFVSVRRVNGTRSSFMGAGGATGDDGSVEIDSPAGTIEIESWKDRLTGRSEVTVPAGGSAAAEITLAAAPPAP